MLLFLSDLGATATPSVFFPSGYQSCIFLIFYACHKCLNVRQKNVHSSVAHERMPPKFSIGKQVLYGTPMGHYLID